ncbi:MAG: PocR ligand-binding domain-containing protein [Desulfobacteraceae bacterium]|jgi:ligand-binding sensor protein
MMAKKMELELDKIIKISTSQKLLDSFSDLMGVASAIIDLEGNVIISSRWKKICTDFHRKNPLSCKNCLDSDTKLANFAKQGKEYSVECHIKKTKLKINNSV